MSVIQIRTILTGIFLPPQAILGILIPFNLLFSKLGEIIQSKQLKAKDDRIKLMSEVLAGMKVLKVYAWEIPFMKRLALIRKKEVWYVHLQF